MTDASGGGNHSAAWPTISLRSNQGNWPVVWPATPIPQQTSAGLSFQPFPLPRLPLSLHCWLTGLAAEFRRRHRSCLAALLILDCHAQRWIRPYLPAQECRSDGACWKLPADREQSSAHRLIGGSFQSRKLNDLIDVAETIPPVDGVHIVQGLNNRSTACFTFLKVEGQTSICLPDDLLTDDWDQALADAAGRITIE